jgi:hypothetical protein
MRPILEKKWEYNGTAHQLFTDIYEAYDSGEKNCIIFSSNIKLVNLDKICLKKIYNAVYIV